MNVERAGLAVGKFAMVFIFATQCACPLAGETVADSKLDLSLPLKLEASRGSFSRYIGRPWMSAKSAVSAYVRYARETKLFDDYCWLSPQAIFLDIDFDGVLELMIWEEKGSACCQYSCLYGIDKKTLEVKKLAYNGSACREDLAGASWLNDDTCLIQRRCGGERCYLSEAFVRSSSLGESYFVGIRRFVWSGCGFRGEYIASIEAEKRGVNSDSYECKYVVLGNQVDSRKAFDEELARLLADYVDLHVRLGVADDVKGKSDAELKEVLLRAYRSFGFKQGNY